MFGSAVYREHLPDHPRDVLGRGVKLHARDPRHHVRLFRYRRLARERPQVKHLVPQFRLALGEPPAHRLDQVEDVLRGGPALPAIVDGDCQRWR